MKEERERGKGTQREVEGLGLERKEERERERVNRMEERRKGERKTNKLDVELLRA